jgi:hypothetical protein
LETLPYENLQASEPRIPWRRLFLAILFGLVWISLLATRLYFDSDHYKTVDGAYYIELAQDFASGKPMVLDGLQNKMGNAFSPYPPGYPVGLAFSKMLFPEWAEEFGPSLALHGFFMMVLLVVWAFRFPLWPLLVLVFGDTFLELGSSTGTEFAFIWSLILMAMALGTMQLYSAGPGKWIWPFFWGLSFFFRYAATFSIPWLVVCWGRFVVKGRPLVRSMAIGFGTALGVFFLFGLWEWWHFGQITGGDRYPNQDGAEKLGLDLMVELFDQLSWFRDQDGRSSSLFWLGWLAVLILIIFARFAFVRNPDKPSESLGKLVGFQLCGLGISQILCTILVRWYFYFAETFDLRLLGPGFSLVALGGMLLSAQVFVLKRKLWLAFFLCLAVGFGLPKRPMFIKYQEWFWNKVQWGGHAETAEFLHK